MRLTSSFLTFVFLACFFCGWSQDIAVHGKITDDIGTSISGASIIEKGTRNGTTAAADGSFDLRVKQGSALIISAIGFEQKTVNAASGRVNVQLTSDVKSLSEVVVTGVGVATSKKKLGISVESITADKLPPTPTSSIAQALIGKVAGAQISSMDGTPGAKTNILLRGVNSLRGGTSPMILVDGLEVRATDLNSLDLNNVERIEVVEGAASSTIYGAQGANGVIQVFTKKGKPGKTSIEFSSSYGSSTFLNNGDLHEARTHGFKTDANNNIVDAAGVIIKIKADGTYTAGVNVDGVTQGAIVWASTNKNNDGSKPYDQNLKYYDHLAQVFSPAMNLNNTIKVSGGSEKSDYAITVSQTKQESSLSKNGSLNRTNFSANIGTELFKGFKIRSSTQLIYQKNNFNPYFSFGSGSSSNLVPATATSTTIPGTGGSQLFSALNSSPFYDFDWKDAAGNYAYLLPAGVVSVNGRNPNYYFQYSTGKDETVDIIQGIQASLRVNRFLDIDSRYGINYEKEDFNEIYTNQSQNINILSRSSNGITGAYATVASSNRGGIRNSTFTTTFQNLLTTANLHFDLDKDFNLKLPITSTTLIGYDYRKNVFKQYVTTGDGLQLYPIYNMTQTDARTVALDFVRPFVTYGMFVNQAFDYGTIAGIKGGFRRDFSSAFGKGATAKPFYNFNGYLRLSQLGMWNGLTGVIPEFKIRGGYGEAGIQPGAFDRYVTLSTRQIGNSLAFYTPSTQSNPDLTVEISKEAEIGTDMTFKLNKGSFLKNATLSATYWKKTSDDVIYTVDAPPSSGGGGYLTNAYSLKSHGFTFALNLSLLQNKDFDWNFTTNFNRQTSEIGSVSTGQDIIITSSAGYGNYVLKAGSKIGQLYGLKTFTSLDQTRQDGTPYIGKADQGKYEMVNGYVVDTATRGLQFTNELYPFGDPNPKFNMAFINNLRYKGLTLSFQFDWVYGNHLYNQSKEWMYRDGIHGDYEKKITVNGQTAAFSNYYVSAYGDMWGSINGARNSVKDYFYEDASFLRMRNVSIGFDVLSVAKIKYFKRLQVVMSGRNLWTITKYTGMDPEVNSGASNSGFDRGVDYFSTPNSKTYQLGVNVGF